VSHFLSAIAVALCILPAFAEDTPPLPEEPAELAKLLGETLVDHRGHSNRAHAAQKALIEMGEPAVPHLVEALKEPKAFHLAVHALGEIGPQAKAALPTLVPLLSERAYTADLVAHAIAEIGVPDDAIAPLVALLEKQKKAGISYSQMGSKEALRHAKAVPALIKAFRRPDANPRFRDDVGDLLVAIGPESRRQALPAFVEALESDDPRIRLTGSGKLASLGAEAVTALPQLITALDDEELGVKRNAVHTLGKIGPEARAAVPKLKKLTEEQDITRCMAAFSLWQITGEDNPSVAILTTALEEADGKNDAVKQNNVIGYLERIGSGAAPAIPLLIRALGSDSSYNIRCGAARALGNIGPAAKDAAPALKEAAGKGAYLGHCAKEALKKISNTQTPDR